MISLLASGTQFTTVMLLRIIHLTALGILIFMAVLAEVSNAQPPAPPSWSYLEDADQDGMKDINEILCGLDPLDPTDGLSDEDGDGLSLAWEYYLGTNPSLADTDGDGWSNSDEVLLYGTDPLNPLSLPQRLSSPRGPSKSDVSSAVAPPPPVLPPSITNGGFNVSTSFPFHQSWNGAKDYKGGGFEAGEGAIEGWSAYFGSTIEAWRAEGKTFVELNGDTANYGIQQPIANAKPGSYVLVWDQLARNTPKANAFRES